jgi:hypothetical protein
MLCANVFDGEGSLLQGLMILNHQAKVQQENSRQDTTQAVPLTCRPCGGCRKFEDVVNMHKSHKKASGPALSMM